MTDMRETILAALAEVPDPQTGRDIVSAGMVQGLSVRDGAVSFAIEIDPSRAAALEPLRRAAEDAARRASGGARISAVLTAHADAGGTRPPAAQSSEPDGARRARAGDKPLRPPAPAPNAGRVEGVASIIAVASGKGGVGKSTVACNLALALRAEGLRVGVLDADVYGPSQPRMLGVKGRPASADGHTIIPLKAHGIPVMSMGFMVEEDQSVVWRGPMLISALTQMLHQVQWGRLDALVVDLPPGTGDVQLSLGQKANVTGAVVVCTPQDIALIDARKALDMFRKTSTPVLGLIENMSAYVCPECGHEAHIFGHGGTRAEAERLGLPFLGELPLDLDTRVLSDAGTPIVAERPESEQARRFRDIARRVVATPEMVAALEQA